jgi:hypothetical protein
MAKITVEGGVFCLRFKRPLRYFKRTMLLMMHLIFNELGILIWIIYSVDVQSVVFIHMYIVFRN